jgi:hypothetical protein
METEPLGGAGLLARIPAFAIVEGNKIWGVGNDAKLFYEGMRVRVVAEDVRTVRGYFTVKSIDDDGAIYAAGKLPRGTQPGDYLGV